MTAEQEKQVLEALYDRLFDAITYQPEGGKNPFTEKETFIHFSKNGSVFPNSYRNAVNPTNPTGDLKATEAFSRMVDQVSPMSLEWEKTEDKLSEAYASILNGANVYTEPDPKAKSIYEKAYGFLNVTKTKKENEFDDDSPTVTYEIESPKYQAYMSNMDDYVQDVTDYRKAYNLYLDDLESDDPKISGRADRNWQATAPTLERNIRKSYQKLTSDGMDTVETALSILRTTINDGIRTAIDKAKEIIRPERQFSSAMANQPPWLLSYASPANWTEPDADNFTSLRISGSNTKIRNSSSSNSFKVDTNVNIGLWRVKASVGGEFTSLNTSEDKDSIEMSAKIAKVNINRPWFMESIFRLNHWATNTAPGIGSISNGKIDSSNSEGELPMYPVAFIVARDIKIKAEYSHEDYEKITRALDTSVEVGWGPVSVKGSYAHGSEDEQENADMQEGEITVPGMQIIGWVSRLVPKSSLMEYPTA